MKKLLLPLAFCALSLNTFAQSYTLTIRSNPANAAFRYVNSSPADMNSNTSGTGMVIADWTSSGSPYVWRSYLKFNLPTLPTGSIIDSAFLSFYANPTSPSGNPGYPMFGTDNAVGIYRCTAAWDTTTLSWVAQPAFTMTNGDTLAQSTSYTQDYLDVKSTNLIKDCYTLGNYGFVMKHLQETTFYNSMIFYSPYQYSLDSNKTPKLVIKYRNTVGIAETGVSGATLDVFPNPAHGSVNVIVNGREDEKLTVSISDILGRNLSTQRLDNRSQYGLSFNLDNYATGCYIVTLRNASGVIESKKLMID